MKSADVERLQELAGKATPVGEWFQVQERVYALHGPGSFSDAFVADVGHVERARFIAAANPLAVSQLLAERARLLEHVRGSRRRHVDNCQVREAPLVQCWCGADEWNAKVDALLLEVDS